MEAAYNERNKTESMPIAQELFRHFYQNESVPGLEKEWEMAQAFSEDITLEEVNEMYNGFLASNSLVITANIPEREGVEIPAEDELMAIYKEVKSSKLEPYEDAATDKPLISEMPQAGTIANEKMNDKLDMKELTLSNGATVYLKKTDFKNDQVLMRAYSKGGLSLAPDNMYYSASAADGIVQQGGLGEFDLITLNKMMTGKRANVSPFIGDRTEGFQGSASPEDLEILFQQLHLYFTSPRIDEEASKAYKDRIKESIKNSQSNPGSVFNDTISAVMANYHMREMPWTEADLEKIELEKAFEFYKERFSNAGDFTFFFVGNFDEAKIKGYLEQYVASLPGSDDKEMWKDNGVRDNEKSFTKEVKKGIEPKSQVRIVMNGDFDFNRENRFDMSSMIEVLRVRLREEIREKMGGVYGIGAYPSMDFYPDGSYKIQILFTTSPTLVDTLVVEVKKVIEEMKEGGFDDKYIADAKELMKREHETNVKENSYWLNTLYTYDYYGEPKEQVLEYMDYVNRVTKDKVVDAANEYLDMDSWKLFVLNPEDS
jgi:zinc protease